MRPCVDCGLQVLPMYGNTHTTTSVTSLQSTLYRHEARDIVRSACGAGEQVTGPDSSGRSGRPCASRVVVTRQKGANSRNKYLMFFAAFCILIK